LIKKQGNRKANIKKTKRIRRGGGGGEKQGEEERWGGGGKGLSLLQQVGGWEKQGRRTNGAKGGEGGGGEEEGQEERESKGTYPVVLAYPVGEWRGDVECRRALKVMILRQIWSAYKGDPKWGRGGVLHHGVQLSDEMLAKDCISIVVPPPARGVPPPSDAWRPPPSHIF
jgi:hypothetical protein